MRTIRCYRCKLPALVVPTIIIPIEDYRVPAFVQFQDPETREVRGVCETHLYGFSLKSFTDYYGSWYDLVRAQIAKYSREVVEPVAVDDPENPGQKKLDYNHPKAIIRLVKGGYKVAPIEKCRLVFPPAEQLARMPAPRRRPLWR